MKNHIIFKFIAIILCAASLMGAVGGALGIVLLTSGGLYDVSVEEMVSMQVSQDSADLADWLMKNYASTELGGASEDLTYERYRDHWFTNKYDPAHYGYVILDAEGKELLSFNPELRESEELYAKESFTASGKYLHVVSVESDSDRKSRTQTERAAILGEDVVLDEGGSSVVPAEGAVVEQAIFADANGQTILELWRQGSEILVTEYNEEYENTWHLPGQALGFLFYSPEGNLVFRSAFDYVAYVSTFEDCEVYEAYFYFPEGQVRLQQEGQVGQLYVNDWGNLMFLSEPMAPVAVEETIPETTEAAVPETTAETLPPETAEATLAPTEEETAAPEETGEAAEQAAAEAVEETVPSNASEIPEETLPPETEPIAVETLPPETEAIPVETLPPETLPPETLPVETTPAETAAAPVIIDGKPLEEYQINTESYYDSERQESVTAQYVYVPMPEMTVEVYMTEAALRYANGYRALEMIRQMRNYLLPAIGICLLLFAVFGVYLCTAAGRNPKTDEICSGGLNRIPLDLYLVAGGFGAACIIAVGGELGVRLLEQDFWSGCGLIVAVGFFASLLLVGFLFAFVSQVKTPGGFWWRNTLCGHSIRLFFKFAMWFEHWLSEKCLPFCGRVLKVFWQYTMRTFVWLYKITEKGMLWLGSRLQRVFRVLWKGMNRGLRLLPVTWQWLLSGIIIVLAVICAFSVDNAFGIFFFLMIPVAIVLYGAYCFGILAESTKRMSKGDLDTKVDDKLMVGCFQQSAEDLNALADVAVVAAQKQLKSERMKTELITNVSHDIKTPLTSIINYVDLLRKPHTEAEGQQYLEVLDRQSQRLKKLIEDLMDMSKANTGNMQVEITTVDAVEAVTQALGEFSDKLDRAQLIPVFRHAEDHLLMRADGRLVWRVLSNLLGNAVKYAMPGTRLYVDLMELEGKVVISLKNISREELRVSAEELMARFVRGDEARNTEGSGLGLNIAQSLVELQKGQLQLLVDGDLFKVTLIFPGAKE